MIIFQPDRGRFELVCPPFFPNGTTVPKSGSPTKTTICTVSRGRLRLFAQPNREKPFSSTIGAFRRV